MDNRFIDQDSINNPVGGALYLTKHDYDTRDYIAGDIAGEPDFSYNKSISFTKALLRTVNQGCLPSCTANSLCHIVEMQYITQYMDQSVVVNHEDQWVNNQGKRLICARDGETGDYMENAVKSLYKNGVKGTYKGDPFTYKIDGYAFESWSKYGKDKLFQAIGYRLSQFRNPIYCLFGGNSKISNELYAGEWKTIITNDDVTYHHAVALSGINYEKRYIEFVNSWTHNTENLNKDKTIASFKISFDVFEKLINNSIRGRRYRFILNKKDMPELKLFVDWNGSESQEENDAVKRAKEEGIIKGVPSQLGPRLEPHRPITRLEIILVLYRLVKLILTWINK